MPKIYHFKVTSLLSGRMGMVGIILILLLFGLREGLGGAFLVADIMGGLWVILALAVFAFGETFYKLLGHRLEIDQGYFSFKTFTGVNWSFAVSSIQAIDPVIKHPSKQPAYFAFMTDNKPYECPYVPKDYQKLLNDLKSLNPKIEFKDIQRPQNFIQKYANTPLSQITKKVRWPIVVLLSVAIFTLLVWGILATS